MDGVEASPSLDPHQHRRLSWMWLISPVALHNVMVNGISNTEAGTTQCAGTQHIVDRNQRPPHEWGAGVRNSEANDRGTSLGLIGWERLPINKEEPFVRALVERGPIAVAVAATWSDYGHGIYDGCKKDSVITHAVLAMGFGVDKERGDTRYWLIQNSWGTGFGENGHIRLKRTNNEETWCGIDHQPRLGTTCNEGPSQVEVCGQCGILYDTTVPYFQKLN